MTFGIWNMIAPFKLNQSLTVGSPNSGTLIIREEAITQ
jgi:hypothetical protein